MTALKNSDKSFEKLKTVVVTGGTTGIGFETAKFLLETGQYRLALIGRDQAQVDEAIRKLESPDLTTGFSCDLRNPAQIQKTVDRILATHKSIYGLVNNAGVYPFGGVLNTSMETWNEAFDVNLRAAFILCQMLIPHMAKNQSGGRVVNVSSTAGILPNHFALAYSVSKAALIQFTKTIAKEVGKDNITVNCVCPGIVRSPLHDAYHQSQSELEEFYARRGTAFPLGRVGEPGDIAGTIRFFLSEDASWITGDVCIIDGGRLLL